MKLNKWLYGAATLVMLAACSDRDVTPSSGGVDDGGDGYIGVKIQLPSVSGTRANDIFDDGEPSEYGIDDATLVLFQGTDMANATYIGSFGLKESDPTLVGNDHSQVTSAVTRVASVSGIDKTNSNNKLYALVLINSLTNGIASIDLTGKKIKDLQEMAINNDLFVQEKPGEEFASSIFMTNSPLSSVKGGSNVVSNNVPTLPVLVELNKTLYDTEKEALDNSAGTIHVERAVAKVTCSNFTENTDITISQKLADGTSKEYTLKVKNVKWDMGQYMTESYLVRNTNRDPVNPAQGSSRLWTWNLASSKVSAESSNKYRMLGHTDIPAKDINGVVQNYYRPYFCQVPGYGIALDGSATYEDKALANTTMTVENAVPLIKGQSAFYPRENTFPVKYMKYANTTRIGFWVTFALMDGTTEVDMTGKNFYISGVDKTTIYLDDANGNDPLTNLAIAKLSTTDAIRQAINSALNEGQTVPADKFANLLKFSYAKTLNGKVTISNVAFKTISEIETDHDLEGVFKSAPQYNFRELVSILNNLGDFYKYDGGNVFYELRIKHFGNDQTPWSADQSSTTIAESYGENDNAARNNDYLGRYGVVRNNWYDLSITKINKLGDPVDPAIWDKTWPDKPDDNKDQYIAVELRVLSWAKRTQEHEF